MDCVHYSRLTSKKCSLLLSLVATISVILVVGCDDSSIPDLFISWYHVWVFCMDDTYGMVIVSSIDLFGVITDTVR